MVKVRCNSGNLLVDRVASGCMQGSCSKRVCKRIYYTWVESICLKKPFLKSEH